MNCSNINQPQKYECSDGGGSIQTLIMNTCEEVAVRLAHKGIFPITGNSHQIGMTKFYMRDINGLIIGASVVDAELLSKVPKQNKNLTKVERNQLRLIGLLKQKTPGS